MAHLSATLYGGLLLDGNVNQELVKQGWCWWYRKYAPGDTVLKGWSRKHEKRRKAFGLIPIPCRRGSAGSENRVSGQAYVLPLARLASACVTLSGTRILWVKIFRRGVFNNSLILDEVEAWAGRENLK